MWVKAFNIHPDARKEDTVMELGYLVGDPIEVDLKSLNFQGPVRVKVACRGAKQIRGETKVFFNGEGYTIRWEPEMPKESIEGPKPTKFDRQRDREEDDYDEEEERDRDLLSRQEPFSSSSKTGWSSQANAGKNDGGLGKQASTKIGCSEKVKGDEYPTCQGVFKSSNQIGKSSKDDGIKSSVVDPVQMRRGDEQVGEEGELILALVSWMRTQRRI